MFKFELYFEQKKSCLKFVIETTIFSEYIFIFNKIKNDAKTKNNKKYIRMSLKTQ